MADHDEANEREERLKSALWYTIGQFVDNEGAEDFNATPQFIGALTELVYTQIQNAAKDLELFSKHGGRKVINGDDVMLLTRRNEALEETLKRELDRMRAADGRGEEQRPKKKGRPTGMGARGKGKA
ncbi:MHF histone-fold complex component [Didymosphaeria variabile]|uniref:MHF histone-fold complex component n=1 Tax=Didymosphaeria variabile TaxID=1932322 RepID=A0A9W8XNX8_9PLEO|nr:MHF histone-fold complex component [Didymosphaeria variabile]KAJ4356115.1 MHF histone-fold complex component [Didymosphaeria variabile]